MHRLWMYNGTAFDILVAPMYSLAVRPKARTSTRQPSAMLWCIGTRLHAMQAMQACKNCTADSPRTCLALASTVLCSHAQHKEKGGSKVSTFAKHIFHCLLHFCKNTTIAAIFLPVRMHACNLLGIHPLCSCTRRSSSKPVPGLFKVI